MSLASSYLFLGIAVFLGVTSNSFAKSAEGFTLLVPSIITAITIVLCMYALSLVMKNIPMGITYASFAGLTIIATVIVGVIKYNQVPNLYSMIGLAFIIVGVLMVNLLGNQIEPYRQNIKLSDNEFFFDYLKKEIKDKRKMGHITTLIK